MRQFFETIDVFTDSRFGGNPLAVFTNASGVDDATMQVLAAEMNLSETTFVLPPEYPENTARIRIFNRQHEMPFAGHPMIGTAFTLARLGLIGEEEARFEIPAGIARVKVEFDSKGMPVGGSVEAPQALQTGPEIPFETAAACLMIDPSAIVSSVHAPIIASTGNPYVMVQIDRTALGDCTPNLTAFRAAAAVFPELDGRFSVFVYAREGETLFARMFAPLAGTWEDPATGSANAPLAGLLLQCGGGGEVHFTVHQGIEMGRPSMIKSAAWRIAEGIRTSVSGRCAPVFSGSIDL